MSELILVVNECFVCGEDAATTVVYEDDYVAWTEGKLAQDAFPYLDAVDREKIISGTHPECWEEMCGDDEEVE